MDITDVARVPGADKLAEVVGGGIGTFAGSFLTVRIARKNAEAMKITARAEAEALGIRAEAHKEALLAISAGYDEARIQSPDVAIQSEISIGEVIEQKIQFQEARRLSNTAAVVETAQRIVGDTQVPDLEPDHDWVARFFNHIQDVSSEDTQLLWARVLAGEVERPGTTSLRTLDILRNLDRQTAQSFRRLCSMSVFCGSRDGGVTDSRVITFGVHAANNSLNEYDLPFLVLNILNEHGLVIAAYNSLFTYKRSVVVIRSGVRVVDVPLTYQGTQWALQPTDENRTVGALECGGVAMTSAGKELMRVIEIEPVPAYDEALNRYFESRGVRMMPVSPASAPGRSL